MSLMLIMGVTQVRGRKREGESEGPLYTDAYVVSDCRIDSGRGSGFETDRYPLDRSLFESVRGSVPGLFEVSLQVQSFGQNKSLKIVRAKSVGGLADVDLSGDGLSVKAANGGRTQAAASAAR